MPLHQDLLKKLNGFLTTSDLFKSVPLSLLLIGLEVLIDQHFSCPCKVLQNRQLTVAIFIGPALFTFCLMFLYVRPFRHGWFYCPNGVNDDTQKNWPKVLISCLIPPVMWIFILFLDGEYFACGMTDWDGCYVFNKKINMSWCHPSSESNNTWCDTSTEDHGKMHLTLEHFRKSEFIGYCVISVFSVLAVVFVGIYDCFVTGKCDCFPNRLLCCCGRRLPDRRTHSGVNKSVLKGDSVTLNYNTEIQKDDKIWWKFGEKLIAKMTGENRENPQWTDEFRGQMTLDPQTGSLIIQQTRPEHTGLYKLKIKTSDKSTFRLFRIIVCDEMKSVSVMKGADVTLRVNTDIQTGDKIFWMFGDDNRTVAKNTEEKCEEESEFKYSDDRLKPKVDLNRQTGDLTIKRIRSQHTGEYTLKIIRNDKSSFKLFNVSVSESSQNAAASDDTIAAGSNQNQNPNTESHEMIQLNQQNQETQPDSVVSQT